MHIIYPNIHRAMTWILSSGPQEPNLAWKGQRVSKWNQNCIVLSAVILNWVWYEPPPTNLAVPLYFKWAHEFKDSCLYVYIKFLFQKVNKITAGQIACVSKKIVLKGPCFPFSYFSGFGMSWSSFGKGKATSSRSPDMLMTLNKGTRRTTELSLSDPLIQLHVNSPLPFNMSACQI